MADILWKSLVVRLHIIIINFYFGHCTDPKSGTKVAFYSFIYFIPSKQESIVYLLCAKGVKWAFLD